MPEASGARTNWVSVLGLVCLALFWGVLIWVLVARIGLFLGIGVDFGAFHAAARTFLSDGPASVYDLDKLAVHVEPLRAYYVPEDAELRVLPVPYPPLFVLLVMPFALLPAHIGFIAWVSVNAGLVAWVLRDVVKRLGGTGWTTIPTVLLSLPVVLGLWAGQPVGFLLLIFYKVYRALERGDDLRAGLWLGLLLIKPQLAIGILAVLVWKRRWHALTGAVIARGAVALLSLLILGADGLVTFYRSILDHASETPGAVDTSGATEMISWRGIVALLGQGLSEHQALAVTIVLSLLTLAVLPVIWRGDWRPDQPRFARQMLATAIVTILVGYDMHSHGALILIVPAMILFLQGDAPPLVRAITLISLYLLPIISPLALMSLIFVVLMVIALAVMTAGEATKDRASANAVPGLVTTELP